MLENNLKAKKKNAILTGIAKSKNRESLRLLDAIICLTIVYNLPS